MAIFNKKEENTKKESAKTPAEKKADKNTAENKPAQSGVNISGRLNDILVAPRITEKTVRLMDKGVYAFDVRKDANKTEVAKAIKLIFKVTPVKVSIINYPNKPKRNAKTGKMGSKSGGKKALVYLKKGDKISII